MPRDSSGNYTLPAGNPVVAGTAITPTWGNNTLNDVKTVLTASLDRSGNGGMLAGLPAFAGTKALPGYAFSGALSSGWYLAGTNDVRFSLADTDELKFTVGTTTFSTIVNVGVDDTGYDVKFFGATSGKSMLWDESADTLIVTGTTTLIGTVNLDAVDIDGNVQLDGTLTVGVDDTGYDVKLFGATSGAYLLWDESADDLKLVGAAGLTVAGDIDVDGTTNLDAVDIDGAVQADATITVGVDDTGYDVKFFGATSGAYMLWDESADDLKLVGAAGLTVAGDIDVDGTTNLDAVDIDGAVQADGTITVGVDDTGYDVKFFGATSGAYMLWDESADDLKLVGAAGLTVAGDLDVDGTTNLDAVDIDGAVQADATITVGVDDTGYDVKFFGATSGAYMLWDESADDLKLVGAAGLTVAGDIDVDGTANLDIVDVDGAVNFAADVTYAAGADIITASAGTSNFRAGVNAGNTIESGGNYNAVVGDEAGTAITTGDNSSALGYTALDACTTGSSHVAIGRNALGAVTIVSDLVAVGRDALAANTSGTANTAVGRTALGTLTDGANNSAFGYLAGAAVSSGNSNTLIGNICHDNLTTGDLNTAIGYNLAPSGVGVDSEIVIGSSITGAGTNTVRIGTGGGTATLGLDGSDTSWAAASDLRLKKDVADSTVGLSFVNDLRPVTFKWQHKNEVAEDLPQYDADSSDPIFGEGKSHHGFIAQEVKAVIDNHSDVCDGNNIWHEDPDGTQQMSQGNLVPMLVKAVQELSAKIEELESKPKCKCKEKM
jgi:cytoskeletal protein CcmA (bactofilin family)